MNSQTFQERYGRSQEQTKPKTKARAFQPDPEFMFEPPQRPCGVSGPVLGNACGPCRYCDERQETRSLAPLVVPIRKRQKVAPGAAFSFGTEQDDSVTPSASKNQSLHADRLAYERWAAQIRQVELSEWDKPTPPNQRTLERRMRMGVNRGSNR